MMSFSALIAMMALKVSFLVHNHRFTPSFLNSASYFYIEHRKTTEHIATGQESKMVEEEKNELLKVFEHENFNKDEFQHKDMGG